MSDVVTVDTRLRCVLVKVLLAVYVSAGTVNPGPGIYNTSLQSHHKTLMFINVKACDLYLNVSYMSQLKGVLMRGWRGAGRGAERLTNWQRCQMRESMWGNGKWISPDDFYSSILLFFSLCIAICHESYLFRVSYLQSINYEYLSFSHS